MAARGRRVVAYDLFGDKRGVIPANQSVDYVNAVDGLTSATITRSDFAGTSTQDPAIVALTRDIMEARLDGMHELRFETLNDAGTGWDESENSRLFLASQSEDKRDPLKVATYQYLGMAQWLKTAPVFDLGNGGAAPDPALGPHRPRSVFVDKTPGQIMRDLIDRAQAAGWAPEFLYNFGGTLDSDGVAWPVTLTVDLPCDSNPWIMLEALRAQGYVDYYMNLYQLRMYIANTYLNRDLAVDNGPDSVILRYGAGVRKAPLSRVFTDLCTNVVGIAENGVLVGAENLSADIPPGAGQVWRTAQISGTDDSTAAEYALEATLAQGAAPREQRTREIDYDWESKARLPNGNPVSVALQPDVDFRIGDRLLVEKGTGVGGVIGRSKERIIEYGISLRRGEAPSGYVIINDRQERIVEKMLRNLERLTAGSAQGFLGPVITPTLDTRRPDAPSVPVPTGTVYLDRAGESKAAWSVVITALETTHDTPGGVSEPIKIDRVHLWARTGGAGTMQRVRSGEWAGSPVTIDLLGYPVDTDTYFKCQSESHDGFLSALSAVQSGAPTQVASDTEPREGETQVYDADFQSSVVRAARAADAGAGFSFVATSGQYRGRFTTNSPTLVLGVAHTATGGRRQVTAGEEYRISVKAKRIGGTSVNARAAVRWYDSAGSAISTDTAFTSATTTGDVVYEGNLTAPAGAVKAGLRLFGNSFVGSPTLEMWEPRLDRRTVNTRLTDDAVDSRTIIATDPMDTKHTVTGALLRTNASTGASMGPSAGFIHSNGGSPLVEFHGATVYINGSLEAGGILIENDVIDFGGLYTIEYTGSSFEINAALTDFSGNVAAGGTLSSSGGLTVGGTATLNGVLDHNGSTVGLYGVSPVGQQSIGTALGGAAIGWETQAQTRINAIRTLLINLGPGVT